MRGGPSECLPIPSPLSSSGLTGGSAAVGLMPMPYFVYIVTNRPRGTIYIGVTNDIARRYGEHRDGLIAGFSKRYGLNQLVLVEEYPRITEALQRENRLKHWNRAWKVDLIEASNPGWEDLGLFPL